MSLPQNIQVTMSASHSEQPSECSPPPPGALGTQSWHQQELCYLCELCTSPRHTTLPPQSPVPVPASLTPVPGSRLRPGLCRHSSPYKHRRNSSDLLLKQNCSVWKEVFSWPTSTLNLVFFFFSLLGIFWCRDFFMLWPKFDFPHNSYRAVTDWPGEPEHSALRTSLVTIKQSWPEWGLAPQCLSFCPGS